jgi:hypothetical protein
MEHIAKAGILTGISMMSIPVAQRSWMPILPGLPRRGATDENLEATACCTAPNGPRLAEVVEGLLGDLLDNQSGGLTPGNSTRLPKVTFESA